MSTERLLSQLLEDDPEDFDDQQDVKDMATPPEFRFEPHDNLDRSQLFIYQGDQFIGTIMKDRSGLYTNRMTVDTQTRDQTWSATYSPVNGFIWKAGFPTKEDAARFLWKIRKANPVESAKVKSLVNHLTEEDEDDWDAEAVKDMATDPLKNAVDSLTGAGFSILRSERVRDQLVLAFSWPVTDFASYHSGVKRAKEVLEPFFHLNFHNYQVARSGPVGHQIARMIVRKRIERDPHLWRFENSDAEARNIPTVSPGWYNFFFGGENVGSAYCEQGHLTAERMRDEMAALHVISPFHAGSWQVPSNAWAFGPAISWWRHYRETLSAEEKSTAFFSPGLLSEQV